MAEITLSGLYLAYRKAKAEAFYENTHFHAIAFTTYERDLSSNLRRLCRQLNEKPFPWENDSKWLGAFSYVPKPISPDEQSNANGVFYRCLDPFEEWSRRFREGGEKREKVGLRLVIDASVDFQVLSALWIMRVGAKYDAALDPAVSFGNRLRRQRREDVGFGTPTTSEPFNLESAAIFQPYFSAYREWREGGLDAMAHALGNEKRIFAVTMDIQKFYHRVDPAFLLHEDFLSQIDVSLTEGERALTEMLLSAIATWYKETPDYSEWPRGALPVGLSASKVISNVLLVELDRRVIGSLKPIYYGRYVDDVFLVLSHDVQLSGGDGVMSRIASGLGEIAIYQSTNNGSQIEIKFDYARGSELIFAGQKQKVFNLQGEYGLDLLTHVNEQIRKQSSEHRLLARLPDTAEEMATKALLAQPDGSLEPDAIRKADVISVRRLGLALLLRDVEAYARELSPSGWSERRKEFYELVIRHVLTPIGFFSYFGYLHRVFGLMVACGDYDDASSFIDRLASAVRLLEATSTAGEEDREKFKHCRSQYVRALLQAGLQATTVSRYRWGHSLLPTLQRLKSISQDVQIPSRLAAVKRISKALLYADWGRRPYKDAWRHRLGGRPSNPPVPKELSLLRLFHLRAVRKFRRAAGLHVPFWQAVVFPTRPMSLSEVTIAAPALLHDSSGLREVLRAFRGVRAQRSRGFGLLVNDDKSDPPHMEVLGRPNLKPRIGIPSFFTSDDEWKDALKDRPHLDLERYERVRGIVNQMMRQKHKLDYIVFPECSIPAEWATGIADRLGRCGISFISGLECRTTPQGVRNDALISLTTRWPWYRCGLMYIQPKTAPSHEERRRLWRLGKKRLFKDAAGPTYPPVYVHNGFCFGVLLCSDFTTISHRSRLQGKVDALFVLEWNKDTETFEFLVESAAHDLHAYIVQVNNRLYGDSRVRVPAKEHFNRDIVRVKGGISDYFVVADLDVSALRKFQRRFPKGLRTFKPLPVGYKMSAFRAE